MASFKERLAAAMQEKGMSQAELCTLSGIPKSAINQYLSGKFKPKQTRTYVIAEVLKVDPAWLMGYGEDASEDEAMSIREQLLLDTYRTDAAFRENVDRLLDEAAGIATTHIFRAAKSEHGTIAPAMEEISLARLRALDEAPETDEDL
ncbi:MAG: helix-turn-helix domain-containing protein [Ruminococcaceae bacterium]|nr:helix-turn-helix domain-containing protein [Oscillospiraceae bacterium]